MSKRKTVSVLISNNRHAFKHYRKGIAITTQTGADVAGIAAHTRAIGTIMLSGTANAYIAIDLGTTGTILPNG